MLQMVEENDRDENSKQVVFWIQKVVIVGSWQDGNIHVLLLCVCGAGQHTKN